ncbi:hypothetical protein Asi02nite_24750 [Asanoa siamensis]|uniref:Uncharacterized protein n=1 Tax=Asanoa siamensis TaxID=926357 RepID=A0ABQ4CNX0_9ACTN|nr:hypothetical protein Asi02nite_24750 [Asanoa siamensis]
MPAAGRQRVDHGVAETAERRRGGRRPAGAGRPAFDDRVPDVDRQARVFGSSPSCVPVPVSIPDAGAW